MLTLSHSSILLSRSFNSLHFSNPSPSSVVVCAAKGPRPRYPRVWKSNNRIGTISKSKKLVECIKGLSNVKEEVYGTLDAFIAWELEFPLITVKKALKTLEEEKEWKRIIQVTKWMFNKGQGRTKGSYFMLLNALAEDGRLEEVEQLWAKIFSESLESMPRIFFDKMVSIYYNNNMHDKMFEVFADMEELGVCPSNSIVMMVGDVFKKLDMLDKYEKLNEKYPPPKWEFRYFRGKRVRVLSKRTGKFDKPGKPAAQLDEGAKEVRNESDVEAEELLNESDEEVKELSGESDAEADTHSDAADDRVYFSKSDDRKLTSP